MPYSIQSVLFSFKEFLETDSSDRLVIVLGALDLDPLLQRLDRRHGRGRRGYSLRAMLYACVAGWVYNLNSIAELRRELLRNASVRLLCGIHSAAQVPSEDAFSRFFARLAEHKDDLDKLYDQLIAQLREQAPDLGRTVAVDSTAINAWADGNRKKLSDPDASWGCKGHEAKGRSKWWFGYKLHLLVDSATELPLCFTVTTAKQGDSPEMIPLLEKLDLQQPQGHLRAVIADAQYDSDANYRAVFEREAAPIIDFNHRGHGAMPAQDLNGLPRCECGTRMRYCGRDGDYVKYTLGPTCSCLAQGSGIVRWRIDDNPRLHPPVPRHTRKWRYFYNQRSSVERVNSRLKEHTRGRTVRHRGLDKVHVHLALGLIVMAAGTLGMLKAGHPEWARSVVQMVA